MSETIRKKPRWGRRILIGLLVLLIAAYTIAWFVMKPMIEDFADNWVEQQRAMGLTVEYSERRVEGFPLNFELVFDDPVMQDANGQARWEGEQIRLHSRTWDFVAMLAQRWGKLQAYVPGKNLVTAQTGARVDIELGRKSYLEAAWTSEAPSYALLTIDDLAGSILDGPNAQVQTIGLDDFKIDVTPTNAPDQPPAYELIASWNKITLPEEIQIDPDTPPMVMALTSQPNEGVSISIRDGGVYFLGQKVADAPFLTLGN